MIKGYFAQLEQRIYLYQSETRFTNVYLSPGIKFRIKEIDESNYKDQILTYGAQLCAGLKFWVMPRFTIDLYFGGDLKFSNIDTKRYSNIYDSDYLSPGYTGIAPVINATFGFKF